MPWGSNSAIEQQSAVGRSSIRAVGSSRLPRRALMLPLTTPTGRVGAPDHFTEYSAEYLDVMDDVIKAAMYAVVAAGHRHYVGCTGREFAIALPTAVNAKHAAEEIAGLAQLAASAVLGGIPVKCECARRCW